jgi:3D (Asp-Asp-Asp) domain-containing protein
MRIKKLLLASLAAFSLATTPIAEAETNPNATVVPPPLVDIAGNQAAEAISKLHASGAIHANLQAEFNPDQAITRAELVTLFLAAKGIEPTPAESSHFADMTADDWFFPYAEMAYRLGLIHGVKENGQLFFKPHEAVEKQELVSILLSAKGVSGEVKKLEWTSVQQTLQPYLDKGEVDAPYLRPLAYALQNNMIAAGLQDGWLRPTAKATRAEAAIYAAQNLLPDGTAAGYQQLAAEGPIRYKSVLTVESTAYHYESDEQKTYLEWPVREGMVAVDPQVIPLGTHLYIEGYGYAVAADVGSAVKQNHIDVFLPSLEAALAYGRQKDTKVYILD